MIELSARYLHAIERDRKTITPAIRSLIIQHEAANVGYSIVRQIRTPDEAPVHKKNLEVELGDLMVQCQMMALDVGLIPEEVLKFGLQHTHERFLDFWG
jgi:hypothetical protein